jgi:hypothetical protein
MWFRKCNERSCSGHVIRKEVVKKVLVAMWLRKVVVEEVL